MTSDERSEHQERRPAHERESQPAVSPDESGAEVATTSTATDAGEAEVTEARTVEELTAALEEVTRERDTYLDHLRRERAEFENFRKRNTRERMDALDRGTEALIMQLLGVLDNFGYVLEAAKEERDDPIAKGAHMVYTELMEVLQKAGLETVPGEGEPFNPAWHDAVMQVEVEGDQKLSQPVVAEVLRTGYRFKGRVLRPASVAVAQ